MTTPIKQDDNDMISQEHCIDLPGETVQCWIGGGTDKLKVILRKHRDVIFDLKLGNGKIYSIESTESDFYSARDKKLILAARRTSVTFRDGERLHLWISRGFQGAFVVSCNGQMIAKIEPNKWDQHSYRAIPTEKPAPIIISIGSDAPLSLPAPSTSSKSSATQKSLSQQTVPPRNPPSRIPTVASSIQDESCPVVCIVDGNVEGMPAHIVDYFKKGGDGSGFSDIDPNNVLTRNWIWGQAGGLLAYGKDNWEWLRASVEGKSRTGFRLVSAKVHYVRGKVRFYFSGYSNSNLVYGRGGYGPGHGRIMAIFSGLGKTKSTFMATVKGVGATFKGAALVSFIFGSVTAIAEWKDDVKKDEYDLAAALIMGAIKAVLAAALAVLIVAAVVSLIMVSYGAALTILCVGALTVLVSVLTGYAVEATDKWVGKEATGDLENNDGIATIIAPWLRKAGAEISESWNYLMKKMPNDYSEISFAKP